MSDGADPLASRVSRSAGALWSTRAIGMALQFVAFGLIASHLGPSGFGVYAFAIAFAELFKIVPEFGFGPIVTRDIVQHPEREARLMPNLFYLRTLLGVIAFVVVIGVLRVGSFDVEERNAALVAALMLVFQPLSVLRSSLFARLKVGRLGIVDVARVVAFVVGVVVLVAVDGGVLAFVWLYVLTNVGAEIVILGLGIRLTNLEWRIRTEIWLPALRAAAPIALAGLLISLYYRLDIVLLGQLQPQSDVGQYGVAYRFLEVVVILSSVAAVVLQPVWAQSVGAGDILQRRYKRVMHVTSQVALLIGITGSIVAWRLLPELPGFGGYDGAGVALSILSSAAAFICIGSILQGLLINAHLQRRLLVIAAWGFAANLILNLTLIPRYSYIGASIATSLTEGIVLVLALHEAHSKLGLRWPTGTTLRTTAVCGALTVVLLVGFVLPVVVQLAAGLTVYLVLAFALGTVRITDIREFLPQRRARSSGTTSAGL